MEAYTTEEQQVEAIKRFWNENGISIVAGIVLGLGGVYGYNYYQDEQVRSAEAKSTVYADVVKQLNDNSEQAATAVDKFVSEQRGSGYAELASLMLAKSFVDKGELDKAAAQLEVIANDSKKPEIAALAQLRLARIYIEQEKLSDALKLVEDSTIPESFAAQASELKGDIYLSQGEQGKAREAYQSAADNGGLDGNPVLQFKLDDLALDTGVVAS